MTDSPYELLVTRDDVVRYLAEAGHLGRLAADAEVVEVVEVTAGNMNRVFIARGPLGSLAVKQAPPWVQVAGPEWPIDPARIASEARTYELLASRVPESIPAVVAFDADRYVIVMEDLSGLEVLRDVLVAELASGASASSTLDLAGLGAVVGRFVGELAVSTSVAALGATAHAELVALAANPELCALTLDVVLDEPYREHEHNHWHPALDERVRALRGNSAVREAVAHVRGIFLERHEALIHGDLHSGSVMVGRAPADDRQLVKVFDPEFSFVGPIGMDLGLFWANLEIAAIAADVVGAHDLARARSAAIPASLDAFAAAWNDDSTLATIVADAWRFAGVEGIRRAAGYSHAADIESLPEPARADASVRLFDAARHHLLTGTESPADPARSPASGRTSS
ncbi:MAG: S-methyl-5-thioribose kinase [Herbiconiux sp.]|uniref:phosphotransferase n=1 Tax=Herbiconiux sp. TaxID=1871186 RepID=UPI0012055BBF|nr:phosphotransferase [Herbiconiux sp.]TAJ47964.1 MAG: S-methyl-5-thioribose kinase [Herbiconiux sp.]